MADSWQKILRSELDREIRLFDAENFTYPGARGIFYNGAPWQGKETRVFAWIGLPDGASADHPVPGVVLVHGGGGTALANWVRIWNEKGYAAIAMDTCGGIPVWSESPYYQQIWPRHAHSGPAGWGRMEDAFLPEKDQWPYHAACAVLRGARVLAAMEEVDAAKIGITGISWGGYLTTLCSGLEPERFCFSIPVYGAGYFNDPQSGLVQNPQSSQEQKDRWFDLWDPANVMAEISMPVLFLTDAEDFAFPLDGWDRSIRLCKKSPCLRRSIRSGYPHNHTVSFYSHTLYDFAACALSGGAIPDFGKVFSPETGKLCAEFSSGGRTIQKAEVFMTRASGWWIDRCWRSGEAVITEDGRIIADLLPGTTAAYFSVRDERDCIWTSELYQF